MFKTSSLPLVKSQNLSVLDNTSETLLLCLGNVLWLVVVTPVKARVIPTRVIPTCVVPITGVPTVLRLIVRTNLLTEFLS
ncbi:MAG: hypothetical protein ACPGVN_09285, partial [Alphaproteobacteria bacterium]